MLLRELIGRKLTNGLRRDLQDISQEVNLKLACCFRQVDYRGEMGREREREWVWDSHNEPFVGLH